jgi:hypothetical protein
MVSVQNKNNYFTILYLPNRAVRFNAKEVKTIEDMEYASEKFKKRDKDFRVIEPKNEETVMQEQSTETIKPRRKNKETKDTPSDSEPKIE